MPRVIRDKRGRFRSILDLDPVTPEKETAVTLHTLLMLVLGGVLLGVTISAIVMAVIGGR
jgi:hypothetical protein